MARYYVAGIPFDDENCLKHYGVKGMKWDQHLFGPDANTKYINWMNDIGKFANNAAKGIGSAVTNAAKTVGSAVNKGANFVTGNQARQDLNDAKNANPADPNYQAKVNRYQSQYNQTLPGMAGQAAQNATNWVNQAGDNVRNGNVANAVGNAANQAREGVGGFFDRIGDWGRGAINDVGSAVTNAGNAVGDWTRGAAQDAKDFVDYRVTGAGYDQMNPSNPEVQEAFKDISESHPSQLSVDSSKTGFSMDPRMVYSPQEAMQFAKEAADMGRNNSLFGRVGNAANAVGDWVGQAARNVGGAVTNAGNAVGDWAGQAARDVGGAVTNAGNAVGDWVNQAGDNVRNGNVANAIVDVYNNSPVLGGLDRAALGAVQNAGNWIGDRARDVGDFVSGLSKPHYQLHGQAITGDLVRALLEDGVPREDIARFLNHSALDDKPEGVTDAFWSNYVASGGTREQYERDWK